MKMGSNFDALKLLKTNLYQTKKKRKENRKGKQGNQFQKTQKISLLVSWSAIKGVANDSILE